MRVAVAGSSSLSTARDFGCRRLLPHRCLEAYMLNSRALWRYTSCGVLTYALLCTLWICHKQYPLRHEVSGPTSMVTAYKHSLTPNTCAKRAVRSCGRRKKKGSIARCEIKVLDQRSDGLLDHNRHCAQHETVRDSTLTARRELVTYHADRTLDRTRWEKFVPSARSPLVKHGQNDAISHMHSYTPVPPPG